MAGTSYLPAIVEVAFGADPLDTGTLTWTDISDYVRRNGIDFSRGWDTEAGEPQAGRLTFTLNNESGDFTPGATGAFGEIRNRLPVRVSAVVGTATGNALTYDEAVGWYDMDGVTYNDAEIGNVVLWTGLVESWRIFWENGVRSQVAVTAVDRWAAIRRVKIDADRLAKVATDTGATLFYPMTESSSPLRERNDAGPILTAQDAAVAFRNVAHPTDPNQSVVTLTIGTGEAPVYGTGDHSVATGVSMTVALKTTGAGASDQILAKMYGYKDDFLNFGTLYFGLIHLGGILKARSTASRQVNASPSQDWSLNANGSATVSDGQWHIVTATVKMDGGGTVTLKTYIDGTLAATASSATGRGDWPSGWLRGFQLDPFNSGSATAVSWAGLMLHDRELSADEAAFISRQATSWTGDVADARAGLLSRYGSIALTTTGTFTATMSSQDLTDKSLADALQECSTAERGTIYIDRDGWPVLTSRSWRVGAAVAFTIPATALGREVSWTLDDQNLANSATVERMVGDTSAATVKAKNDASVTTYGEQNRSLQIWVDTDAQLLERANAEANIDAYPLPRSSDLTVDLLTKAATIPAATLLAADIGQRIAVSGLPAEAPGETEFYIENIADKITTTGWERTFTVSPRADYWTLQDATYGALDSTFVLAF